MPKRGLQFLALGAGIGAGLAYFLDPTSGRRRRAMTADQAAGRVREAGDAATRAGRAAAAQAQGVAQKVQHLKEEPKDYDDATLKDKVESEIFRAAEAPKGSVNVNVQEGVVQLRGEVETPELIDDLVAQTLKVKGVRDVENLLHVPGTEAPMHE